MAAIDGHTKLLGLFAHPAAHSLSPAMYQIAFDRLKLNACYLAFDVDQASLPAAMAGLKALNMRGCNLSMPNKEAVLPLLDHIDRAAALIGSVNTVVNQDGRLFGYTTDGIGFMNGLKRRSIHVLGKKITLLGAGGAGKTIAIQAALDGVKTLAIVNRQGTAGYQNALHTADLINKNTACQAGVIPLEDKPAVQAAIAGSVLLANTTNVGMGRLAGQSLIQDPSWFRPDLAVVDIIYAPRTTALMEVAKHGGSTQVFNGLDMLLGQGQAAFRLWFGQDLPLDLIRRQLFKEEQQP